MEIYHANYVRNSLSLFAWPLEIFVRIDATEYKQGEHRDIGRCSCVYRNAPMRFSPDASIEIIARAPPDFPAELLTI